MVENEKNNSNISTDKADKSFEKTQDKPAKNFMRKRPFGEKREPSEFEERVIEVSRVSRTVKGGRRIRFRALVVIGDRKGRVGMGLGKANDVSEAVKKAVSKAKKQLVTVPIINGTIPYEVTSKHGSAVVMLKPATTGTSIVAGGSVRAVADLAGISDLLSKMLGSSNKVNNVIATLKAFASFNPEYIEKIKQYSEKAAMIGEAVKSAQGDKAEDIKVEEKVEAPKKPRAAAKKAAKKNDK
jgi:small subunit ribosomal protein S5